MASGVWLFKTNSAGKLEIAGERPPSTEDGPPPYYREVDRNGHLLVVRISDGLAYKCRKCEVIGLVESELCAARNEHNDEGDDDDEPHAR